MEKIINMQKESIYTLPTYVALQATYGESPQKYLGVVDDGSQYQDYVAYSTSYVTSIQAKFAIEYVSTELAHIRSCYNNKYLVKLSSTENWIVAKAVEPVDDQTSWNCTLFKPIANDGNNTITFLHVQQDKVVGRRDTAPDLDMFLCLDPLATTTAVSKVVDYGSLVILPKYVTFKDYQNLYINQSWGLLRINSQDIADNGNCFEVIHNSAGNIRLRDSPVHAWGRFPDSSQTPMPKDRIVCLREDPGDDDTTDTNILFQPVQVEKNVMALRYLYNNYFVESQPIPHDPEANGLRPTAKGLVKAAHLQILEPVLRREVNVLEFHLDRARIYDQTPITFRRANANNPTLEEQEHTTEFHYTKLTTSSWNNSQSWFIEGSIELTSKIPFIEELKIALGGQYSEQYDWGETNENSEEVVDYYTVKVPPMTLTTVSAIATQGKCDVPFSYVQVDHMYNGDTIRTTLSDGVYTGMNAYNFDYLVENEPIVLLIK